MLASVSGQVELWQLPQTWLSQRWKCTEASVACQGETASSKGPRMGPWGSLIILAGASSVQTWVAVWQTTQVTPSWDSGSSQSMSSGQARARGAWHSRQKRCSASSMPRSRKVSPCSRVSTSAWDQDLER